MSESDCPAKDRVPVDTDKSSIQPPSQTAASSRSTEELPVSTQVFQDLMELAEDCMVPSQCSRSASCSDRGKTHTYTHPHGSLSFIGC